MAGITNDKLQLESLACRQQGLVAVQSSLTGDLTMASFLERVRAQYQHPRASRILDPDQTGQAPALELTFFLEMITRLLVLPPGSSLKESIYSLHPAILQSTTPAWSRLAALAQGCHLSFQVIIVLSEYKNATPSPLYLPPVSRVYRKAGR